MITTRNLVTEYAAAGNNLEWASKEADSKPT